MSSAMTLPFSTAHSTVVTLQVLNSLAILILMFLDELICRLYTIKRQPSKSLRECKIAHGIDMSLLLLSLMPNSGRQWANQCVYPLC